MKKKKSWLDEQFERCSKCGNFHDAISTIGQNTASNSTKDKCPFDSNSS